MKKGFTLLELLVVIAILAAMAAFVLVRFTGSQRAARDTRRQSDIKQFQNAVETYANANNGFYPDGNPTIGNAVTGLCGSGRPLGAIPCADDPQGTNHYQYSTDSGNTQYVIWATLEKPNASNQILIFYVCSNGFTGTRVTTTINNGVCP